MDSQADVKRCCSTFVQAFAALHLQNPMHEDLVSIAHQLSRRYEKNGNIQHTLLERQHVLPLPPSPTNKKLTTLVKIIVIAS